MRGEGPDAGSIEVEKAEIVVKRTRG